MRPSRSGKNQERSGPRKEVAAVLSRSRLLQQTTPGMREIADEYNLPLVELPPTTAFVEVTEAIIRQLAARSSSTERAYMIDACWQATALKARKP